MNNRAALSTVFLVVLVDLIGFGIVLPLLPFYADRFGTSPVMTGFLFSIYSLAQFFFSPIWGQRSDRVGRRPVMLISTAGAVLAYVIFAFSHSLEMLLFSRLLAGIMGGNIAAAQAYVADVTTKEDRTKGMGMIGAAFGIGFVLGPALATLLIQPIWINVLKQFGLFIAATYLQEHPYTLPGIFAAVLSMSSFLLVLFKLPESHRPTGGAETEPPRSIILTKKFWQNLFREDAVQSAEAPTKAPSHSLLWMFIAVWVLSFGQSSLYGAFPLFCQSRFEMTPGDVGLLYIGMGAIAIVVQGGLIRVLVRKFSESRLFLMGSVLMVGGLGALAFAPNKPLLTLFLMTMSLGFSLNGPTLNSLISKQAESKNMGATLGASQGMAGLGRVVGPTWGGYLYGLAQTLPFVATACIVTFTVGVGVRLCRPSPAVRKL